MMTDNGRSLPDWLEPDLHSIVTAATDRLEPRLGTTVIVARVAHEAYEFGRAAAISELLTTEQAAAMLGLTVQRTRALAQHRGVGWRTGRDWLFRPEDLAAMRERRTGRPRKVAASG